MQDISKECHRIRICRQTYAQRLENSFGKICTLFAIEKNWDNCYQPRQPWSRSWKRTIFVVSQVSYCVATVCLVE